LNKFEFVVGSTKKFEVIHVWQNDLFFVQRFYSIF